MQNGECSFYITLKPKPHVECGEYVDASNLLVSAMESIFTNHDTMATLAMSANVTSKTEVKISMEGKSIICCAVTDLKHAQALDKGKLNILLKGKLPYEFKLTKTKIGV